MFESLSSGFKKAKEAFSGKTTIDESHLNEAADLVRSSLLEADVSFGVVEEFIDSVKERLRGELVQTKAKSKQGEVRVKPADYFVKTCKEELENILGDEAKPIQKKSPTIVMMCGLQGSGKTTSTGKIAHFLARKKNFEKPLLVAADIYRPAAIEQLEKLGERLEMDVFTLGKKDPVKICKKALDHAKANGHDLVMLDTAGRLAIDKPLMKELTKIQSTVQPHYILFVCDGMIGQDAVETAKAFHDELSFDSVVLTKMDGDTRGGAALSIRSVTGKPVRFMGMGEGLEDIEAFRPEGLASRILGLGDIVSLMDDFEKVSQEGEEEKAERILRGEFTLMDFYDQIAMIQKMGSMKSLAAKLPLGQMGLSMDGQEEKADSQLKVYKTLISSMTKDERQRPALINQSRAKRISLGSGRSMRDLQQLLKMFEQMKKMLQMFGSNMGMLSKIPGLGQLAQMKGAASMAKNPEMQSMMQDMQGSGKKGYSGSFQPSFDRDKRKKLAKLIRKKGKK